MMGAGDSVLSGTRIGVYEIQGSIGAGGMGEVLFGLPMDVNRG
jgi:hypothetical protein